LKKLILINENGTTQMERETTKITLLEKLNDKKLKIGFLNDSKNIDMLFSNINERNEFLEIITSLNSICWCPYLNFNNENNLNSLSIQNGDLSTSIFISKSKFFIL
jgi:hypothetical protein